MVLLLSASPFLSFVVLAQILGLALVVNEHAPVHAHMSTFKFDSQLLSTHACTVSTQQPTSDRAKTACMQQQSRSTSRPSIAWLHQCLPPLHLLPHRPSPQQNSPLRGRSCDRRESRTRRKMSRSSS